MDRLHADWRFKEGDEVVGADDHKMGKVIAFYPDMFQPTHLVVQRGLLFHTDIFVPISVVNHYDGSTIFVSTTTGDAMAKGWDQQPVEVIPTEDEPLWSNQ